MYFWCAKKLCQQMPRHMMKISPKNVENRNQRNSFTHSLREHSCNLLEYEVKGHRPRFLLFPQSKTISIHKKFHSFGERMYLFEMRECVILHKYSTKMGRKKETNKNFPHTGAICFRKSYIFHVAGKRGGSSQMNCDSCAFRSRKKRRILSRKKYHFIFYV